MVDRDLSLGGGRTPIEIWRWARVGDLKQSIYRQCTIEPTGNHTLLVHNNKLEALEHYYQVLDTIGITDRSSVFATLRGTLSPTNHLLFLFLLLSLI